MKTPKEARTPEATMRKTVTQPNTTQA